MLQLFFFASACAAARIFCASSSEIGVPMAGGPAC
jgi:hypothetical protein